jgi:hypothetical protein
MNYYEELTKSCPPPTGNMFGGKKDGYGGLPVALRNTVIRRCPELDDRKFLPVLLTGSREALGAAVLRALATSLTERMIKVLPPALHTRLKKFQAPESSPSDNEVLDLLEIVTAKLIERGVTEGILLILDEAGKFLEHAALHPEAQDIMLLQRLAEFAQRSGSHPFIVICLFHVAFSSYAAQLSASAQKEWDKVAGRFEEIPFVQPLNQTAELIAAALRVDTERVPKALLAEGIQVAEQACRERWLGAANSAHLWRALAPKLFPIDPVLLPVAFRFFQRFAQHERSLFNFLFSHEPFGLRAFNERPLSAATWLRLPQFFDYVRANLGQRLSQTSYRTRWPAIEAVLDSSVDLPELDQQILKTIGLLNVLGTDDLRPTEDAVVLAVAGMDMLKQKEVRHVLAKLTKNHRIFFRGKLRGYCVWPYSSVDLDKVLDQARREVSEKFSMADSVQAQLPQRALVARRHYIETGNLRHFDVEYIAGELLSERLSMRREGSTADGRILVALCEDEAECKITLALAQKSTNDDDLTLIAVTRPLRQLRGFVLDAQRWEWVSTHTPELNTDRYANEEVSRQLEYARDLLARRLAEFVGLDRLRSSSTLTWFQNGHPLESIHCGRDLLRELSNVCDKEFGKSGPLINNELINRHAPSSAATGARMRLIERVLTQSDARQLGIPEGTHPPEMSMYLSVLHAALLHRENESVWGIYLPNNKEEDPCNLRHIFAYLRQELENSADKRISLPYLYEGLARPPFGVRQGLMPLFVAVFFSAHAHELAFYERNNFVADVNGDMFLRLTKVPEIFELQWCRIEGLRAEVLEGLRQVVSLPPAKSKPTHLLEIVRPLCRFAVDLPEYTKRTRQLSPVALATRDALFNTREPVKLLMHQLPEACGLTPFVPGAVGQAAAAQIFVRQLHIALRELNGAYSELLQRLEKRLAFQFRLGELPSEQAREQIIQRAKQLRPHLREPRLP